MPNHAVSLDRVFFALADATRLAVLNQLSRKPTPVSELAKAFDMALPSFMQHLKVLEEQGLVASEKQGRVRTYYFNPEPLAEAEGWLEKRRQLWERRLDRLDGYLQEMKVEENDQA